MVSINVGDIGTATSTAAAATINHTEGQITTEALTTAAVTDYSFTLTNNAIAANSLVFVSANNGTNTIVPIFAHSIVPSAGSVAFKVRNGHASSALNGTLILNFLVV